MDELQKHIDFAEKQLIVYRYHGHPDVLKMEALYNFLVSLKKQNCKTSTIDIKTTEAKKEFGPQGSLFDASIFTKKNPHA